MASESTLPLPRPSWNKGLTATTDARVAQMARAKTGKANWARGIHTLREPTAQSRRDGSEFLPNQLAGALPLTGPEQEPYKYARPRAVAAPSGRTQPVIVLQKLFGLGGLAVPQDRRGQELPL